MSTQEKTWLPMAELAPWPRPSRSGPMLTSPALVCPPRWMDGICRGIAIGVCVAAGSEQENELGGDVLGHAHAGEWLERSQDWICLASWSLAFNSDGGPGETLLHELSHLLNPNDGHGELWRETLDALMRM